MSAPTTRALLTLTILTICSFMEGARLQSSVALPREVAKEMVIEDGGEKVTLKEGEQIVCNLVCKSTSMCHRYAEILIQAPAL